MAEPAARRHVLIVDDEEGMVETLGDILEAHRYRVTKARTGTDAVTLVGREVFDAVLLDVVMPGMNGFEALRAIRARAPGLRVAMMTAFPRHELSEQARLVEAAALFTKPVEIETILGFLTESPA